MQDHVEILERKKYVKQLLKSGDKFKFHGEKPCGAMQGQISTWEGKEGQSKFCVEKIPARYLIVYDGSNDIGKYNMDKYNQYTQEEIVQHCATDNDISELNNLSSTAISALNIVCNEVMAGGLALLLFGRDDAAVTAVRFNKSSDKPCQIISRIKYSDCTDLFDFFVKDEKLFEESVINERLKTCSLTGFGENLVLKILLGDLDIKLDSFITPLSGKEPPSVSKIKGKNNVYAIDWTQAFFSKREKKECLEILKNPESMVSEINEFKDDPEVWYSIKETLEEQINMDSVNNFLKRIAEIPDNHLKGIGERLKKQLGENEILTDETKEFIDDRTKKLLEIKEFCKKNYLGERPKLLERIAKSCNSISK